MTTLEKITVLLVDDHPVWREGLRQIISLQDNIDVVGEVPDGDQALKSVIELAPQVVLLDVNLPKINGLQVATKLKSHRDAPAVVMLTAYDDREQAMHAIRAGAAAYCSKDIEPAKLIDIIEQVAQGKYVVQGDVYDVEGIQEWIRTGRDAMLNAHLDEDSDHLVPLSPREMEILRYVTLGNSNQEIAFLLGISHQTVKNHMTSILRKLDVQDRTQAAVYAIAHGWVRVNDAFSTDDSPD
ncbi:MAG: response regulator [Anaerolineales bacterium]